MEDIICKAEIKLKFSKKFKLIASIIIGIIVIIGLLLIIPVHSYVDAEAYKYYGLCMDYDEPHYNIFGHEIYSNTSHFRSHEYETDIEDLHFSDYNSYSEMYRDITGEEPYIYPHFEFDFYIAIIIFLVAIGLIIVYFIFVMSIKFIIKRCSLQLTKDGISGNRKHLCSSKFLQLPIEKIDSILIKSRIIDKLLGGQTVAIRSASGLIHFICVQNAHEFVDKTLETIKTYKESNQPADTNIPTNTGDNNLEQIKKLKEMLDSDIITQEEFDAKKKQLLGL